MRERRRPQSRTIQAASFSYAQASREIDCRLTVQGHSAAAQNPADDLADSIHLIVS